jgi:uncharacterized damage-inducible protein DinB
MKADAQVTKAETLSGLAEARQQILEAVSALQPGEGDIVFLGTWSVKDLLAHLAGWDYANLEAAQAVLAGRLPAFYAHIDRDWKTYNALLVEKYKLDDLGELVASVRASRQEMVDFLEGLPAEQFDKDMGVRSSGYKVTIARLLKAETRDERVHAGQIREYFSK